MNEEEVLAVCLKDESISHMLCDTPKTIQKAICNLKWGKSSETKPFLDPSKTEGIEITKDTSSRRRAVCIYLSKLPMDMQVSIQQGLFHMICMFITNCS